MAIVPQRQLFSWKEIENLADMERLSLLLKHLPDEQLMQSLESGRGKGRNDYPIRAMWNSILAGIVYQHTSIESLHRELMRNAQLRRLCGLLEGFRQVLAIDSKAIKSRARRVSTRGSVDLQGELDADKGFKAYRGTRSDGSSWETVKSWFGFKLHLIVDAEYELPVAYSVSTLTVKNAPSNGLLSVLRLT